MSEHLKFKVWWIPQIPMKSFEVSVSSIEEGRKLCEVLADYDLFQFENKIKPDYCNSGGVVFRHPAIDNGAWLDVPDDEEELQDWRKEISEADASIDARKAGA